MWGVGVALGLQLIAAARTKKKASERAGERIECRQRNGNEIYLRHYEEAQVVVGGGRREGGG